MPLNMDVFTRTPSRLGALLLTLWVSVAALPAQTDVATLTVGTPLQQQLAGPQVHSYPIVLARDQYLQVVVEQQGIDVIVGLLAPNGQRVVEVDGLNGNQGPEALFFVAPESGTYRLEVRPFSKTTQPGRYEAKIQELRTALKVDRQRVAAESVFQTAAALRNQGTPDALKAALPKFEEAVSLFHDLRDSRREVLMLNFTGLTRNATGESTKAVSAFNQALSLARTIGDRSGEAVALSGQALVKHLSDPPKAIETATEALRIFGAIGDMSNQATTLATQGLAYLKLRDLKRGLETYSNALAAGRAVGDLPTEARSLNGLGYVYRLSAERQKALNSFNQALPIAHSIGDRLSEADALTGLGLVNIDLGEAQKGLDYFLQSLPLFRAAGDRGGEAVTLNGMGQAYGTLGNKQKTLESFTQALPLARAVGDRGGEAMALIGIGLIEVTLGQAQKGLDLLREALSIARDIGNRQTEAEALVVLGYSYGRTGQTQQAIESFNQSLSILRSLGNREDEALALALLGFVHLNAFDLAKLNLGDLLKARELFTQALTIAREVGNPMIEAQALNGLGALSLDNPQQAQDYISQSLVLSRKGGNRGGEADALNDLGFAYFLSNEPQKAIESFSQGLNFYRAFNDRQSEVTALMNLALVERSVKQLTEARAHTEAAIAIVESLRVKIVNQEGRKSYFSSAQDYYKFYIDLLMLQHDLDPSAGHDGEALQANERSRARALLDTPNEAKADITQGVDPQLLEREHSLQQRLNSMAQDQMKLLSGKHTEAEADALATELSVLTTSHEQVKTTIRQSSPNYAALTQPQPLTLKEIQTQVLDADTLLLEYSLGSVNSFLWNEDTDEDSYLWAVTSDSIQSYELAGRSEIEAGARQLYDLVNARNKRQDVAASPSRVPAARNNVNALLKLSRAFCFSPRVV